MKDLEIRNQKIIDAIIEKAKRVCPESLAMIGICGSFATGDYYEKSDLDLLVLINDDNGWQLSCTFIQDDLQVGHDIYCTTWEKLEYDSLYNNPNIAKLMDSKIVYCADEKYMEKLEALRKKAKDNLSAPLSKYDYLKAEKTLKEAEHFYLMAMTAENMTELRVQAGYTLYYIENAVAMLNKKYFRYGVKRVYEELALMEKKPHNLCEMIESVLSGRSSEEIKSSLTTLVQETMGVFKKANADLPTDRKPITADSVKGTYEEMFSNWRNKTYAAVNENNPHLAYMSLISFSAMLSELSEEWEIAEYNVFENYDPQDLRKTTQAFDELIEKYLQEYKKVDLQPERYRDIDEFVDRYLG